MPPIAIHKGTLSLFLFGIAAIFLSAICWPGTSLPTTSILARDDASLILENEMSLNASLLRRDDYSCGPGKPCSNGACCGASGYCGYGPTYCGAGCVSNCGAVAECGQYAVPANRKCPLNTCCSQYGFCGTTQDFCDDKCQSNCVLHPKPPGNKGDGVLSKVIGYYEGWSARSKCHKVAPTDLPVHALTHVNFAFAYIDPKTYSVAPMDSATPVDLFRQVTDLKSANPSLKVFISIGGWTFSDNGTATQPLYGEIAADAQKRVSFATQVVRFMQQYGFDGLDIDWEYPGAPDRGGKPEDTENFVSLLSTLRSTFDSSAQHYGLTFTAPSSYWYLKWFDLPNLIKYADWINLMSYDLHGVWDRDNPIGSIVQGHTNLTEIKLAAELFWRVNIPPSKIALGFGFYGRSFTLADPSCSKPGCPFSGASKPGPCTDTGGILAYYEIQDIIKGTSSSKRAALTPVHDTEAAVNYLTFDNDQWISYDDSVTFKQKVDWANEVGLTGSLIWASDLDDPDYSAHSDLLGKKVEQNSPSDFSLDKQQVVVQSMMTGQQCVVLKNCVNLDDKTAASCSSQGYPGWTVVGWDDAGCGKKNCHCGKPICCPANAVPKSCMWRGGKSGDCNAQCLPGEVSMFDSSWGGGFTNDGNTDKCGRGWKAFCCESSAFASITTGCKWSDCGKDCGSGYDSLFSKYLYRGKGCSIFGSKVNYCCPDPSRFTSCRWSGGSAGQDCANAECNATEVEMDRDDFGDSKWGGCSWNRQKAACCSVGSESATSSCGGIDLCELTPGYCADDDTGDLPSGASIKRGLDDDSLSYEEHLNTPALVKRGGKEKKPVYQLGTTHSLFHILRQAFPRISRLLNGNRGSQVLRIAFALADDACDSTRVAQITFTGNTIPTNVPRPQSEHSVDASYPQRMISSQIAGILLSGRIANTLPTPQSFWDENGEWQSDILPATLPVVGDGGISPRNPQARVSHSIGTTENRNFLLVTQGQINGAKGNFFWGVPPVSEETFQEYLDESVRTGNNQGRFLDHIRTGMAVVNYMNLSPVRSRIIASHALLQQQLLYTAQYTQGGTRIARFNEEFRRDYYETTQEFIQSWVTDRIRQARSTFQRASTRPPNYDAVIADLSSLESKVQNLEFNFIDDL